MRRAARIDANQTAIVEALRQVGATVQHLHTLGGGVPDLLVAKHGQMWLMELKNPQTRHGLTSDEIRWIDAWSGPVYVVESVEDALQVIGAVE